MLEKIVMGEIGLSQGLLLNPGILYYNLALVGEELTKITWLWRGGEGPHDMPQGAYMHLVTTLQVDPDYASQLKCVEETSFEGDKPVRLIRLFDPGAVTGPVKVERFASLDQYPDLILFEGHTEIEGGKVYLHDRRSLTSPSRCEGVKD